MHELMLTQAILETATRYAAEVRAARVTDLYFVVGQFSDVADESVQFYWDQISPGTICEGARLHFDHAPANLQCLNCGHMFTFPEDRIACPLCASEQVRVLSSIEFRLDSINIVSTDEVSQAAIGELIVAPEHQH
jgi:hydrogenase nickel incorporation protein HypA/HybF